MPAPYTGFAAAAGFTAAMYHHVSPYGIFRLAMNERVVIEELVAA